MLANVATSAASQRFSAPDDAQAARGTSYAQTCSPGWTPAFRGLLRGCRAAPAVGPTAEAASCAAVAARARNVWCGLGVGGVGASLRPALAGRLIETDERVERRGASEFWFPGAKKASPASSLSEIAISLNCEQNSARKFQTGVSNSGPQIPKHARQNSEVPEITYFS